MTAGAGRAPQPWRGAAAGALAAALSLLLVPARAGDAPAASATWSLEARSARHSDALTLAAIDREAWPEIAPRPGRNLTYLDEELRLGWRDADFTVALLARHYATLVASADALSLVAQVSARRPAAADRDFAVQVQTSGFAGAGLAFGTGGALGALGAGGGSAQPGWRWDVEMQALALGRWLDWRIDGSVHTRAGAETDYTFDARSRQLDSRLEFPFQEPFERRGAGLLLAGALAWQGEGVRLRLALGDGGWLHWRGVPQQEAVLSTATRAVDAEGFVLYRPLVQGRYAQASRTQWMPWRSRAEAAVRLGDTPHELGARLETIPGFGALPVVGWRWMAADAAAPAFGAEWRLHERRLDLSARWRGLELEVGADRLGAGAHSRRFALGWSGAF